MREQQVDLQLGARYRIELIGSSGQDLGEKASSSLLVGIGARQENALNAAGVRNE